MSTDKLISIIRCQSGATYRVTLRNKGSFEKQLRGIKLIKQSHLENGTHASSSSRQNSENLNKIRSMSSRCRRITTFHFNFQNFILLANVEIFNSSFSAHFLHVELLDQLYREIRNRFRSNLTI